MPDRSHRNLVLRFESFELDASSNELRKAGSLVKLQAQPFQLLVVLAERHGEVITREEIRRALWDDQTFVDFDRSINFCINQIRAALGDDPQSPRFIETVPRKGYRFIAAAAQSEEALELATRPRRFQPRWQLLAGAGSAVAAAIVLLISDVGGVRERILRRPDSRPIQSLAVLPLSNLSHDPEQEYFAEGMTDELITALAKIGALRVVSRTSVMQYQGTKKPLAEIARELNVDAVVEGTVLRAQNRVRITAQLIRASPEEHLWAEKYDGNLEEVLTLQDTVAQDVAHSIKINLTPRERTLLRTPRAVDAAAYELYLKGRYLWDLKGEENLIKSREFLEQAIEKDPGYALAWAGLADTYNYLSGWGVLSSQDALPRARAAAGKALELDSSLVGPLVTLADVKARYEWDWAGAERLCKRAIELAPNYGNAHHTYATYLAEVGRMQEAVVEARRALDVEPLSLAFGANVAWKLYYAHHYQEAEGAWRKLIALNPGFTGGYGLASLYLQTGRPREAVAELQDDASKSHRGALQLLYLGHALGVTGARAEGRKVLKEMLSQRRYVPPEYIAIVHEGLGERDQALRWFEKAYEEHSMNAWILPDPRLDAIRTEPRFRKIMQGMGLPR